MKKVLLLENIDTTAKNYFEKKGYQLTAFTHALSEKELAKELQGIHLLGIRSKTKITKKSLSAATHLQAIGAFCVGTDQIDLDACSVEDLTVFNAPFSNTRSVAELVIGEIIMLMRQIFPASTAMHQGTWSKSAQNRFEIRGKIVGIVGYGNIGTQVSVLAESLGMKVLYYDVAEKLAVGNATKCKDLKSLLKIADVVTVHVDGRKKNNKIFSDNEFNVMKKGSSFINLSRGKVVDLKALATALRSNKLSGAAVDVYPQEPEKNGTFITELQNIPNVILTPHIAGSTQEAQKNIAEYVSQKLHDFVVSGNTDTAVLRSKGECS